MNTINFQFLRDEWAVKHKFTHEQLGFERTKDRNANPHNETYHNKKPRRSDNEIISDLAYTFADEIMINQYKSVYEDWLSENGYTLVWNVYKKRN